MKTVLRINTISFMLSASMLLYSGYSYGQSNLVALQHILVNTSSLEGLDITPDNMWGFQVQSTASAGVPCRIDGSLVFRKSNHSIRFHFYYTIQPGLNSFDPTLIHPVWSYSSTALRELFTYYKILPQGTYQYCITVTPNVTKAEYVDAGNVNDCIYKQSKDLFSIMLAEPSNNAQIYEHNPMLVWIATYPFVNELTYKVRVAEIKEGQNTENAITRNNLVYAESNIVPSSIIYPIYAKPLRVWQPYAWTVDAFYKGILLGGAEPWKFTIIEDTLKEPVSIESSFIDINIDKGTNVYDAVGRIKLMYQEDDYLKNELKIQLIRKGKKSVEIAWPVQHGTNFKEYDCSEDRMRHNEQFEVLIEYQNSRTGKKQQTLKFKYVNPEYVK